MGGEKKEQDGTREGFEVRVAFSSCSTILTRGNTFLGSPE